MAETQRITTYGVTPPCANSARLEERGAGRIQKMFEKNRKFERPEEFILHESSEDEEEANVQDQRILRKSYNFVDYVRSRESDTKELRKFDRYVGTRHLLSSDLLREFSINVGNMDKIFSSQWLSNRQIVFGTKCNKLMVYNVVTGDMLRIPSLNGWQYRGQRPQHLQQYGIYSIQINPSRNLLATVAKNNKEIAIYKMPTLDPVCVGDSGHYEWIYDMCWIDDEFLVSGSKDTRMALWHIDDDLVEAADKEEVLTHRLIRPVQMKKCRVSESVRALVYNKSYKEIAIYSTNSYVHVWSADRFCQKLSRKLSARHENPCLAVYDDRIYAAGCQSYTALLDARTLQAIRKIPSKYTGCGIKSASFEGTVLTIGTGVGMMMFYDLRANKYLESAINPNRTVMLRASSGYVFPDDDYGDGVQNVKHTPAIYTHCYDASSTRLFCAGGPLMQHVRGNYAALWQ